MSHATHDDITAHADGVLMLGESVTFHDNDGQALSIDVHRENGPAHVVITLQGNGITVTPVTARALARALAGMANTAEIITCLHP